ncbi:hypothetical protein GJ496_010312, partial [Pomphorhynchus laevis]
MMSNKRKLELQFKRSQEKLADFTKDSGFRFRHLYLLFESASEEQCIEIFSNRKTLVFIVIFDFLQTRVNLVKLSKDQLKNITVAFRILQSFIKLVPSIFRSRWQANGIYHLLTSFYWLHTKPKTNYFYLAITWYNVVGTSLKSYEISLMCSLIPAITNKQGKYRSGQIVDRRLNSDLEVFEQLKGLLTAITTSVLETNWDGDNERNQSLQFFITHLQRCYISKLFDTYNEHIDILFSENRDTHLYNITKQFNEKEKSNSDSYSKDIIACRSVFIRWLCRFLHECTNTESKVDLNCSYCPKSPIDSHLQQIGQAVLLRNKHNICLLLEMFRQACLLPLDYSGTLVLALKISGDWIHRAILSPIISECWQTEYIHNAIKLYIVYASDIFKKSKSTAHYDAHVHCCSVVLKIFECNISCKEQKSASIWIHLFETMFINLRHVFQVYADEQNDSLIQITVESVLKLLCRSIAYQVTLPGSIWTRATELLCQYSHFPAVVKAWTHVVDCLTSVMSERVYQVKSKQHTEQLHGIGGAVSFRSTRVQTLAIPKSLGISETCKQSRPSTQGSVKKHIRSRSYSDSIAHLFYEEHKLHDISGHSLQFKNYDNQYNDIIKQNCSDGNNKEVVEELLNDLLKCSDSIEFKLEAVSSCEDIHDISANVSDATTDGDCDSISNSFFCKENTKYNEIADDSDHKIDYDSSNAVALAWRSLIRCIGRPVQILSEESKLVVVRKFVELWNIFCGINEELLRRQLNAKESTINAMSHLFVLLPDFLEIIKTKSDNINNECILTCYEYICTNLVYKHQMFLPEVYQDILLIVIFQALQENNKLTGIIFEICKTDLLYIKNSTLLFNEILRNCQNLIHHNHKAFNRLCCATMLCSLSAFTFDCTNFDTLCISKDPDQMFAVESFASTEMLDSICSTLMSLLKTNNDEIECCRVVFSLSIICSMELYNSSDRATTLINALLTFLIESNSILSSSQTIETLSFLMSCIRSKRFSTEAVLIIRTVAEYLQTQVLKYIDGLVQKRKDLFVSTILSLCRWICHVLLNNEIVDADIAFELSNKCNCVFSNLYQQLSDRNVTSYGLQIMKALEYASSFLSCSQPNIQFQCCWQAEDEDPNQIFLALNNNLILSFTDVEDQYCRLILRHIAGKYMWIVTPSQYVPDVSIDTTESNIVLQECHLQNGNNKCTSRKSSFYQTLNINPPRANKNKDFLMELLRYLSINCKECLINDNPIDSVRPLSQSDGFDIEKLERLRAEIDKFNQSESADDTIDPAYSNTTRNYSVYDQHGRISTKLIFALGFFDLKLSGHIQSLSTGSQLLRELRHLDTALSNRETHKIAVIYVGTRDLTKSDILSRNQGSAAYECFLDELGEKVDLFEHEYFLGRLPRPSSSDVSFTYYYCEPMAEIIFHVSTMMGQAQSEDYLLRKVKHIGNDEVHIVWSDALFPYNRSLISTEFATTVIIIQPIQNFENMFQINIDCTLK